jgi:hypothetical protein
MNIDLIKPADDSKDPSVLHPATRAELSKFVDPSAFLVSSIFCLFSAVQLASSFTLQDPNGQNVDYTGMLGNFMNDVSNYFSG